MTNISNFLKIILAVLILGLPLFFIFKKDHDLQKSQQLAKIDSVLIHEAIADKQFKKYSDSLKRIIILQDSIIRKHETRLSADSKRTDSLRSSYHSIVIDRPKY